MGVGFHLLASDVAQTGPQMTGCHDEQRQDRHTDQRQAPFQRQHHRQDADCLDDIGDDAHNGIADRILRPNHIVIQPAHQLSNFGVGEEAQ